MGRGREGSYPRCSANRVPVAGEADKDFLRFADRVTASLLAVVFSEEKLFLREIASSTRGGMAIWRSRSRSEIWLKSASDQAIARGDLAIFAILASRLQHPMRQTMHH